MGSILSKPIAIMDMVFYYNIVACNKVIYVGRTFHFNRRKQQHEYATNHPPLFSWSTKNNTKLYKRILELHVGGWEKVSMNFLEHRKCKSKEEMSDREMYWIHKYKFPHLCNSYLLYRLKY